MVAVIYNEDLFTEEVTVFVLVSGVVYAHFFRLFLLVPYFEDCIAYLLEGEDLLVVELIIRQNSDAVYGEP